MSENNEPQEAIENDDPAETTEQEASAQAEETPEESAPVQQKSKQNNESRGELIKFGILAIILIGSIAVVAFSRPLIFDRIVPAVMGDNETAVSEPDAADPAMADEIVIPAGDPAAADQSGVGGQDDPNVGGGVPVTEDAGYPAPGEDGVAPADAPKPPPQDPAAIDKMPTAVPSVIHTVQAGETLVSIAAQYNTTVEIITAINHVANPDQVAVGTELIIPQP